MSHRNNQADVYAQINDSAFQRYPNFLEFVVHGLNIEPYPAHVVEALQLHGEICYVCSDVKKAEQVTTTGCSGLREHLVLMEHGVCPKCKATRYSQLRNGSWNLPHTHCSIYPWTEDRQSIPGIGSVVVCRTQDAHA